jgi:hypothetical protein
MTVSVKVKGGPLLKARLEAVADCGPDILAEWADTASDGIRRTAPVRTGRGRASIRGRLTRRGAGVFGAYWLIFVDRGTKAHTIEARNAKALRFEKGGRTIFARKVFRRRMPRNPFITKAAQDALVNGRLSDQIIEAWNRRRGRTGGRRLDL